MSRCTRKKRSNRPQESTTDADADRPEGPQQGHPWVNMGKRILLIAVPAVWVNNSCFKSDPERSQAEDRIYQREQDSVSDEQKAMNAGASAASNVLSLTLNGPPISKDLIII